MPPFEQEEIYAVELSHKDNTKNKEELPKGSRLKNLCPFIDRHSLLQIEGYISKAKIGSDKKHTLLLSQASTTLDFCM